MNRVSGGVGSNQYQTKPRPSPTASAGVAALREAVAAYTEYPDDCTPPEPGSTAGVVARLRNNHPVTLDANEQNGVLTVSRIVVTGERGTGTGAAVMKELLDHADRNHLTVALTPSATFGGSKTRLEHWYRSMGFRHNKGRRRDFRSRESMVRDAL